MDIQALDQLALEMNAAALLIDAAGTAETLSLADLAPGLHATLRRWVETIEAVSASAAAAGLDVAPATTRHESAHSVDKTEAGADRARHETLNADRGGRRHGQG